MDFKGKVALITGAGNGIGRATALAFAKRGAKVVVVDRDGGRRRGTAGTIQQQGGEARASLADVTKSADVQAYVKAALDAYGRIDCFFNNAGIEGKRRADRRLRRGGVRPGHRRQRQGRVPRPEARAAGDAEAEVGRGREYGLGRRPGRHAGMRPTSPPSTP